jgi:acyl carrier protein
MSTVPLAGNNDGMPAVDNGGQREELLATIAAAIASVRPSRAEATASVLPALHLDATLTGDLALSSLEVMKLALALEQRFGLTIEEGAEFSVRTVGELLTFIEAQLQCRESSHVPLSQPTR